MFSKVAEPVYIPTSNVMKVPVSPHLCQLVTVHLFDYSYVHSYDALSH